MKENPYEPAKPAEAEGESFHAIRVMFNAFAGTVALALTVEIMSICAEIAALNDNRKLRVICTVLRHVADLAFWLIVIHFVLFVVALACRSQEDATNE